VLFKFDLLLLLVSLFRSFHFSFEGVHFQHDKQAFETFVRHRGKKNNVEKLDFHVVVFCIAKDKYITTEKSSDTNTPFREQERQIKTNYNTEIHEYDT